MNRLALALVMARAAWSYRSGQTRLSYLPPRLWIDPVSDCNFRCVMCPNRTLTGTRRMAPELFRAVIDEARRFVHDAALVMAGEPLLHPQLEDFIAYAEARGIRTWINTNASLLDRARTTSLLATRLSRIVLSLDGYTRENYERIRVGGVFAQTVANVQGFLATRGDGRRPHTTIQIIEFADAPATSREKSDFLTLFAAHPPDRFKIVPAHSFAGTYAGAQPTQRRVYFPCTFLWYGMNVMPDGRVNPCCLDLAGTMAIGQFPDRSLAELWNCEQLVAMRADMVSRAYPAYPRCAGCDMLWKPVRGGLPLTALREYAIEHFLT